jgi:hypothetical protein
MPITRKPRDSTGITPEMEEIRRLHEVIYGLRQRLDNGHHYLMGVRSDKVTTENALVAFGWTREGLNIEE